MTDVVYTGIPGIDYPEDGLDFFDKLQHAGMKSKTLDILAYLYHYSDDEGYIAVTYKEIQAGANASYATVARVMKKLKDCGAIERVQQGVWKVPIQHPGPNDPFVFIRKVM